MEPLSLLQLRAEGVARRGGGRRRSGGRTLDRELGALLDGSLHARVLEDRAGQHRAQLAREREVARVVLTVLALLAGHVDVRVPLEDLHLDAPQLELHPGQGAGRVHRDVGEAEELDVLPALELRVEAIHRDGEGVPQVRCDRAVDVGHVGLRCNVLL